MAFVAAAAKLAVSIGCPKRDREPSRGRTSWKRIPSGAMVRSSGLQ
jgi:hypothetical protein